MLDKLNQKEIIKTSDKIFLLGVFVCILSTQGMLLNFIFAKVGIGFIKSFLFEIGVFILVISVIYKQVLEENSIRFTIVEWLILSYVVLEILILLIKSRSLFEIIYAIRETWLVILLIIVYKKFSKTLVLKSNFIIKLLLILNILNLIAAIVSFIVGPEKYMLALTGRFVYGIDPILKFKISHIKGLIRTPALIGESASFSYFGALSYIIFNLNKNRLGKIVSLVNVIISFTRSGYVLLIVYTLLMFIKNLRLRKPTTVRKMTFAVIFSLVMILCIILFISNSKDFISKILSYSSIIERFEVWNQISDTKINESIIDYLIGGGLGETGNAGGSGMLKVFDNTWMFLYYNIGLIGLFLFLSFWFMTIYKDYYKAAIIIGISISMCFVNMFQSKGVIALLPIAIILCDYIKLNIKIEG